MAEEEAHVPSEFPTKKRRHRGGRRRRNRGGQQQGQPQSQSARHDPPQVSPDRGLPPVDEAALVLPESFRALGLEDDSLKALAAMGFEEPTPIQEEMIPLMLAGRDVLGQARTGTGKTAAFAAPVIQQAVEGGGTQALILVPTRELAVQVAEETERLARFRPVRIEAVYGGTRISSQLRRLAARPEIVIGTPGRVMDMLERRALSLEAVRWGVLDEVDRMLDIGFRDDIRRILRQFPRRAQMAFCSATLPDDVNRLIDEFSCDLQRLTLSADRVTVEQVRQFYVSVAPWDKYRMLRTLLETDKPDLAIVFTNTRHQTQRVCERLQRDGVSARHIHGDLLQRQRNRVMAEFREQQIHVLVATDLMGRGIDVAGISHIINYDIPKDVEAYVHRIGRTARMGAVGVAISLVTPEEGKELTEIEKLINLQIEPRPMPDFAPSPPPAEHVRELAAKAEPPKPPESRLHDPVFADEQFVKEHGRPPKTLGSPFKAPLRRKLKRLRRR